MTKPTLFISGGTGMVGKSLLFHRSASQYRILSPPREKLDLMDRRNVADYFRRERPQIVIHAAGRVGGIQANIQSPVQFLDENLLIGANVVKEAAEFGVEKFINLASTCIYPPDAKNPLQEDAILAGPLELTNEGYALAKITTLKMCQYINRETSRSSFKTLIPCNLFGRYDHFDSVKSHLIPAVIMKIHIAKARGDKIVEIWGDGSARREFMDVRDLADGVFTALENFDDVPEITNCGFGKDHSILEYYETVKDVVGWEGKFVFDLSKPTGMRQKLADSSTQKKWGWAPSISLRDGIAHAYEYFLEAN